MRARDLDVAAGWAWVEQVGSVLAARARSDAALADKVNAALPADHSALEPAIGALAKLLTDET